MVMLSDGAEQRDLGVRQIVRHWQPSGSTPRILADRHQACIAARRGCVGRGRAFLDQVGEVVVLACGETGGGQSLESHDWPSAARELAQAVRGRRLVAFEEGEGEGRRAQRVLDTRDPVGEL